MKPDIKEKEDLFRTHKSYTPEEVFAAGGTTAFGLKTGKSRDSLIKALQNAPKPEPFSDEEWDDLMTQLDNDK